MSRKVETASQHVYSAQRELQEKKQQQRETEVAELTRQLKEMNQAMVGLQMDKESLTEQRKRAEEEVGVCI